MTTCPIGLPINKPGLGQIPAWLNGLIEVDPRPTWPRRFEVRPSRCLTAGDLVEHLRDRVRSPGRGVSCMSGRQRETPLELRLRSSAAAPARYLILPNARRRWTTCFTCEGLLPI
jgi:hypothetical protein